jgi:imidazolonepropionase-like amidohydrolase
VTGLTSAAGELLGAPGLGRLEAGARANLVRTTGDPLQPRHRVTGVWIDGRPASLETRQTRLRDTWTRLSPR